MNKAHLKSRLRAFRQSLSRGGRRIRRGLSNTSEFFERRFKRVTKRTTRLGDSISQADSGLLRFFKRLTGPFKWFYKKILHPLSGRILSSPLYKRLKKRTYWAWYPLVAIASFVTGFFYTRSRAALIGSLAFVLLVGGSLTIFWFFARLDANALQKYRAAFQEAVDKGEFGQAQLYQQKLQSLGVGSTNKEMAQIENLAQSGNLEQALALAEQLAPLDKPGFPEAHFWLARKYLEEQASLKGEPSLARAQTHLNLLKRALAEINIKPLPVNVVLLAAMIDLKQGNAEKALQQLRSVSARYWPALVLQLEIHLKLSQHEAAMQDALAISQAVRKELGILDEVSPAFFPMWCQALAATKDREELKFAIRQWFRKYPDDVAAEQEWGVLQFFEIEALMIRGSEADMSRALAILIQTTEQLGMQHHPLISSWLNEQLPPRKNQPNFLRLAEMAAEDDRAPSILLEVLGTAASLRSDQQTALELLNRAIDKEPENLVALNNLAYVISLHFPQHYPLALEMVERAVKIQPSNVAFLHTRGLLFVRLEKWDKAIADLVIVAAKAPNAADVHRGLAIAYRAIGKPELAAIHEALTQ
jgi:tetratricopeptide (TPR) repeat protein